MNDFGGFPSVEGLFPVQKRKLLSGRRLVNLAVLVTKRMPNCPLPSRKRLFPLVSRGFAMSHSEKWGSNPLQERGLRYVN